MVSEPIKLYNVCTGNKKSTYEKPVGYNFCRTLWQIYVYNNCEITLGFKHL